MSPPFDTLQPDPDDIDLEMISNNDPTDTGQHESTDIDIDLEDLDNIVVDGATQDEDEDFTLTDVQHQEDAVVDDTYYQDETIDEIMYEDDGDLGVAVQPEHTFDEQMDDFTANGDDANADTNETYDNFDIDFFDEEPGTTEQASNTVQDHVQDSLSVTDPNVLAHTNEAIPEHDRIASHVDLEPLVTDVTDTLIKPNSTNTQVTDASQIHTESQIFAAATNTDVNDHDNQPTNENVINSPSSKEAETAEDDVSGEFTNENPEEDFSHQDNEGQQANEHEGENFDDQYQDGQFVYNAIIQWQDNTMCLFPPLVDPNLPDQYLLDDSNLAKRPLSDLFRECREALGDHVKSDYILCIDVDSLDLNISEDLSDCTTATISQIIDVYHHLNNNDEVYELEPLTLTLFQKPKLITALNNLARIAEEGRGYETFRDYLHSPDGSVLQNDLPVTEGVAEGVSTIEESVTEYAAPELTEYTEAEDVDHQTEDYNPDEPIGSKGVVDIAAQEPESVEEVQPPARKDEIDYDDDDDEAVPANQEEEEEVTAYQEGEEDITAPQEEEDVSATQQPEVYVPAPRLHPEAKQTGIQSAVQPQDSTKDIDDDLIDYSDDEEDVPTSRSSTVQGDKSAHEDGTASNPSFALDQFLMDGPSDTVPADQAAADTQPQSNGKTNMRYADPVVVEEDEDFLLDLDDPDLPLDATKVNSEQVAETYDETYGFDAAPTVDTATTGDIAQFATEEPLADEDNLFGDDFDFGPEDDVAQNTSHGDDGLNVKLGQSTILGDSKSNSPSAKRTFEQHSEDVPEISEQDVKRVKST
ncbi:hypothetical protein BT63DRAFT_410018 [Microthyrium microscopicum]|uniref:Uncharacterized protein n=1 Tax=Microthyrium microscopicum TaxID=703497 RepID=A0A6A6UPW8_9PEZI|nr:hypothetical protein BT63DRAFT_410018 [Microthyrium microscopicum]